MGVFSRFRRRPAGGPGSQDSKEERGAAQAHLEEFAHTRVEVEAYVEPATTVTPTTLLLVAEDGEWTRRAVPDRDTAFSFARKLGLRVYDINQSGYPSAMREYNARTKQHKDGNQA